LKRYQEVIELHREGRSYRAIARQLGLHRMTVARYVQAGSFPEHAGRSYSSHAQPFDNLLRQRWNEGCRNAAELTRELGNSGTQDKRIYGVILERQTTGGFLAIRNFGLRFTAKLPHEVLSFLETNCPMVPGESGGIGTGCSHVSK
jgi:hypothetical protein